MDNTLLEILKKIRTEGQKNYTSTDELEVVRKLHEEVTKSTYEMFLKISEELMATAFSKPFEDTVFFGFDCTNSGYGKKFDQTYSFSRVLNVGKENNWDFHRTIFSRSILKNLFLENGINCLFYLDEDYCGRCAITANMKTMIIDEKGTQMGIKNPE